MERRLSEVNRAKLPTAFSLPWLLMFSVTPLFLLTADRYDVVPICPELIASTILYGSIKKAGQERLQFH
jgi:hypothetical protein